MRNSSIILGISVAVLSGPASAQMSDSPRDGTNNVKSDMIERGSSDPVSQYTQQQALNNVPGQNLDKATRDRLGTARPAKPSELLLGAVINDRTGVAIAKIDEVDPDGVVVSTGSGKVKLQPEVFGHNKIGLLLDMTKADFEKVVAKAQAGS